MGPSRHDNEKDGHGRSLPTHATSAPPDGADSSAYTRPSRRDGSRIHGDEAEALVADRVRDDADFPGRALGFTAVAALLLT